MIRILQNVKLGQLIFFIFTIAIFTYYYVVFEPARNWTMPYLYAVMLFGLYVLYNRAEKVLRALSKARFSVSYSILGLLLFFLSVLIQYSILLFGSSRSAFNVELLASVFTVNFQIACIYLLYFMTAYVAGEWVIQRFRLAVPRSLMMLVSIGVGFIIISLFSFILALFHTLSVTYFIAFTLIIIFIRYRRVAEFFVHAVSEHMQFALNKTGDVCKLFFIGIFLVYLSFLMFNAFQPEPVDTDSIRSYHYVPKLFVEQKGFVTFPYDYILHTAKGTEMLYVPLMYFEPYVVSYFTVFTIFLLILALYFIAQHLFSTRWAVFSSFVFISMPIVHHFAMSLKVDVSLTFISLIFFYVFYRFLTTNDRRSLVLSAVFFGFAVTVKYSILVLIPMLVLILFFSRFSSSRTTLWQRCSSLLLFGAIALATASPWLVKNTIDYGNPVHPFLSQTNYIVDLYEKSTGIQQPEFSQEWGEEFTRLNFQWNEDSPKLIELFHSLIGISKRSLHDIGPIVFGLLVLSLYSFRRSPLYLILVVLFVLLWYQYALYNAWYLMFFFPLIILAGTYAIQQFKRPLRAVVVVTVLFVSWWGYFSQLSPFEFSRSFWLQQYDMYDYRSTATPNITAVNDYISNDLAKVHPDYLIYTFNYVGHTMFRDSYKHIIMDPSHFGLSYIYNHTKDIAQAKEFLVAHGINYILFAYPSFRKEMGQIDTYKEYPFRTQDLTMIDELVKTSRFAFINKGFLILNLTKPQTQ